MAMVYGNRAESSPLCMAWLPWVQDWSARLSKVGREGNLVVWRDLVALANARLDFGETLRLDRALLKRFAKAPPQGIETRSLRIALLGSSTLEHLMPGLRVGALRHGLWIDVHAVDYGQYLQAISDTDSSLYQFAPEVVLFAFDAAHLFNGTGAAMDAAKADAGLNRAVERVEEVWRRMKSAFNCIVIQQTLLPVALPLLGGNEHQLAGSPLRLIRSFNERLRQLAGAAGVDVLAIDEQVSCDGLGAWHDPVLWHKAKQEIAPLAVPMYGELVARILAARQGRSAKCLVLDLDNTLWGGVIGDDGLEGIKLGQGSALGEAYVAVQKHALELSRRGIILAVCSKNDEAVALTPFDSHPEMILRRGDIACFVANWDDKATNLRRIASSLNLGLDTLVLLDDNPYERNQVRQELPMVRVLELPEEPALYPRRLAESGCFEAVTITADDAARAQHYQASLSRETLKASASDMQGYLRSLGMELVWAPFDRPGLQRIVQLINKTNQFNLTTRRYTEPEVEALLTDADAMTLQIRLLDCYGDNGIIGIVIGRRVEAECMELDAWLMSCRVLGRGVELATMNVVVEEARRLGVRRLIGTYLPTARNGMVKGHYASLGFQAVDFAIAKDSRWLLDVNGYVSPEVPMVVRKHH